MLTIKLSSSYVLIIITTFRKDSESGESTSPGCPGKYVIWLEWPPAALESAGADFNLAILMFHFLADTVLFGVRNINKFYCLIKILSYHIFYFI